MARVVTVIGCGLAALAAACIAGNAAGPGTGGSAAPLTIALHLDRTVSPADGDPIPGYVEITNDTRSPITISDVCNGWLGVGLTNPAAPWSFATTLIKCPDGRLPVGTSRRPVTIETTYEGCSEGRPSPGSPKCIGDEQPPLPPGRYRTKIQTAGLSQRPTLPHPISVTLAEP